jgi:hypothetical protein
MHSGMLVIGILTIAKPRNSDVTGERLLQQVLACCKYHAHQNWIYYIEQ